MLLMLKVYNCKKESDCARPNGYALTAGRHICDASWRALAHAPERMCVTDGVRKEKERLTAAATRPTGFYRCN